MAKAKVSVVVATPVKVITPVKVVNTPLKEVTITLNGSEVASMKKILDIASAGIPNVDVKNLCIKIKKQL